MGVVHMGRDVAHPCAVSRLVLLSGGRRERFWMGKPGARIGNSGKDLAEEVVREEQGSPPYPGLDPSTRQDP